MSIEGNRSKAGMFYQGEHLGATKLNYLGELAGYGTTLHSTGAKTIQGPAGTVFMDSMVDPADIALDFPFKVIVTQDPDGWMVYVRPGTVNGRIPKIYGKYMDAVKPNLLTLGDANTTYDIVIKATKGETIMFFPDEITVDVKKRGEYSDSDNDGYIAVASVTIGAEKKLENVSQFIFTSQVVSRIRAGTTTFWSWSSR